MEVRRETLPPNGTPLCTPDSSHLGATLHCVENNERSVHGGAEICLARRSQCLKRVGNGSIPFPEPPSKAKVIPISQMGKQVEAVHLRAYSLKQNWDQRPLRPNPAVLPPAPVLAPRDTMSKGHGHGLGVGGGGPRLDFLSPGLTPKIQEPELGLSRLAR